MCTFETKIADPGMGILFCLGVSKDTGEGDSLQVIRG